MARKKKTKRKLLSEEAELLSKKIVKLRDNFTCQKCGTKVEGSNCQASHVIPVTFRSPANARPRQQSPTRDIRSPGKPALPSALKTTRPSGWATATNPLSNNPEGVHHVR